MCSETRAADRAEADGRTEVRRLELRLSLVLLHLDERLLFEDRLLAEPFEVTDTSGELLDEAILGYEPGELRTELLESRMGSN